MSSHFQLAEAVSLYGTLYMVLFSLLIPLLILVALKRMRIITSYRIEKREERVVPLFVSFFVLLVGAFFGYDVTSAIILGLTAGLMALLWIITLFWKVSLHGAGIGMLSGLLIYDLTVRNGFVFLIVIGLTLMVFWARRKEGAHNWLQLIVGWICGFAISLPYFMIVNN